MIILLQWGFFFVKFNFIIYSSDYTNTHRHTETQRGTTLNFTSKMDNVDDNNNNELASEWYTQLHVQNVFTTVLFIIIIECVFQRLVNRQRCTVLLVGLFFNC